ncbi:lipopolysaccharide biosynthesis protein [Gammaproteobacteria bacterium]|nr:lipopolysaccharide biosynthesis protein [Gammaproteobacteria bacterium]
MNLGESIRSNTLWLLSSNVAARLIGFAASIVLARLLFPEDFGLFVTISVFTGVASLFAGGGMGEALVQAKELKESDYRVIFTMQLLIGVSIYFLFFHTATWFASFFEEQRYIDLLRVSTLTFIIRPFANIPRARLRRAMRFKEIALIRLASILCGTTASVSMAYVGLGVWSLVFGALVGATVNLILIYSITRWVPGIRFEQSTARRLGGYGLRVSTNEIVSYLRGQTANFIISRQLGPAALGLYNKADSLSGLPAGTISGSAYQTVFRALSKVQDNLDQSKYIYFRTITLVTVYTLPFYVGLVWLAEPFIVFVYGQKWSGTALPLQILAATGLFRLISDPSGAVIAAQNRLGYEIRIQIETMILLAIGCLAGLRWGIVGVAIGVLPSFVFLALRLAWLANNCINGSFRDLARSLTPALKLNAILFVVLAMTHQLLPTTLKVEQPALYLCGMTFTGALVYSLLFLYAPVPALAAESMRWKRKLRLTAS